MTAHLSGEIKIAEGSGEYEGLHAVTLDGAIFTDNAMDAALARYVIECTPDVIAFAREQAESNDPMIFNLLKVVKFATQMIEKHPFSIDNALPTARGSLSLVSPGDEEEDEE